MFEKLENGGGPNPGFDGKAAKLKEEVGGPFPHPHPLVMSKHLQRKIPENSGKKFPGTIGGPGNSGKFRKIPVNQKFPGRL